MKRLLKGGRVVDPANGVAVRMSVLYLLAGGNEE